MDDLYEYATTAQGIRLRACIWESSDLPITWVKWSIQRYYPEFGFWRTIKREACPYERSFEFVPQQLAEVVEAYNDGSYVDP